ncbi:Auxin-responsive family protein [Thalictrum thalictroides]|uniref:Auxin-responsive family protein n=1 Tax=Thalictrum thalictroides TaxID=46969 RepID=A0A7J6WP65_THATH|nr:Auxin-responsive family protein [Thalictrum thalictroides]
MKQLIRRLSRVADSSNYSLLRSDSRRTTRTKDGRNNNKNTGVRVPQGHIPVYVGDEMERFLVSAEFLNHPIFLQLLNKSAQEYGYEQQGVLKIPCAVLVFRRVLHVLQFGDFDDELKRHFFDNDFDELS